MPFDDTQHAFLGITFEELAGPAPRTATRTRPRKPAKKRTLNYASRSTAATLRKQEDILAYLELVGAGATISEIGGAIGISRQLALYHIKKMAATGRLVMVSEPCVENGGLQFRCWREESLVAHFATYRRQVARRAA